MPRKPTSRSKVGTRDRILKAAIERFSRNSYEQTGLRDIAADVGVDVAYVHRCFRSKKRLFAEAVRASLHPADLLTVPAGGLPASLARDILTGRAGSGRGLDLVVRSLSSPEASPVVREFVLKNFMKLLAEKFDQPNGVRSALVASLLTGVAIFRNVLRVGPMLEGQGGDLEGLIANAILGIMGGTHAAMPSEERERIPL